MAGEMEARIDAPKKMRLGRRAWHPVASFFKAKPVGAAGGVVVLALVLVAILAPLISPYDYETVYTGSEFRPPGGRFLLGTDNLGRDLESRIIWGSQVSLRVGLLCVIFGTTGGSLLGVVSGYLGGKPDFVIQRFVDAFMAFPMFVLAMAVVAMFGPSERNVIIAIAISLAPQACRTIRSSALVIRETQYIEAAAAIGCSQKRIVLRHVLPNCVAPYIIIATMAVATAILVEATLSFLGLGIQPPTPSWGQMASTGRKYAEGAPWLAIFPGIAITLAVFGFSLLGDALRDVLDPRLRQG